MAKVLELMKWVHAEASIAFDLPAFAHLKDEDIPRFKEQVAEREANLEAQRKTDQDEMDAEEERKRKRREQREQREKDKKAHADSSPASDL